MKAKNIIILVVVVVVIATIFYAFMGSKDQTSYINSIQEERKEKESKKYHC